MRFAGRPRASGPGSRSGWCCCCGGGPCCCSGGRRCSTPGCPDPYHHHHHHHHHDHGHHHDHLVALVEEVGGASLAVAGLVLDTWGGRRCYDWDCLIHLQWSHFTKCEEEKMYNLYFRILCFMITWNHPPNQTPTIEAKDCHSNLIHLKAPCIFNFLWSSLIDRLNEYNVPSVLKKLFFTILELLLARSAS